MSSYRSSPPENEYGLTAWLIAPPELARNSPALRDLWSDLLEFAGPYRVDSFWTSAPKTYGNTPTGRAQLTDALAGGRAPTLIFRGYRASPSPGVLDTILSLRALEYADLAVKLEIAVSWSRAVEWTAAGELIDLIRRWFARVRAAAASISDRQGDSARVTPHELQPRRRALVTWDALNFYARGAAWAMGLGPGLCARLGGPERVLAEAPVPLREPLGQGVWLQCSSSPFEDYAPVLTRLEAYLHPLLDWTRDDPLVQWPRWGPPVPETEPTAPSARGQVRLTSAAAARPVPLEYLPDVELDTGLNVYLAAPPSERQVERLRDLVGRWYGEGVTGGFGGVGLHDLGGPTVDGSVLRWRVDFGSADPEVAIDALARELGAATDLRVERLLIGVEHVE